MLLLESAGEIRYYCQSCPYVQHIVERQTRLAEIKQKEVELCVHARLSVDCALCMFACVYVYVCVCIWCVCVMCVSAYAYVCAYMCKRVCLCMCKRACLCVCVTCVSLCDRDSWL